MKTNNNSNTLPQVTDWFKKETAATILTCIIHSHINNLANPGSYNTELNKVFKLNNIPPIIMPENPPSKEILSLAATAPASANLGNNQEKENEASDDEEEMEEEKEQEATPPAKITGKAIGLRIITKKSIGWPRDTLYHKQILEGIREGKYKYIYTSSAYSEEEIYDLLKNNDINLKDVWVNEDDSSFKKIRNGLYQEKTPPTKGCKQFKRQNSL